MSDELKAKLVNILDDFYNQDQSDRTLEELQNELIAQIDQAYKDAGYRHFTPLAQYAYEENAKRMTGQEWYERFEKELDSLPEPRPAKTIEEAAEIISEATMQAAKRAAGLE